MATADCRALKANLSIISGIPCVVKPERAAEQFTRNVPCVISRIRTLARNPLNELLFTPLLLAAKSLERCALHLAEWASPVV